MMMFKHWIQAFDASIPAQLLSLLEIDNDDDFKHLKHQFGQRPGKVHAMVESTLLRHFQREFLQHLKHRVNNGGAKLRFGVGQNQLEEYRE